MITQEQIKGSGKGNPPRATIDFETRSRVNLPRTGPWRYATDPSTQPLCMSYRLPFWPQGVVKTWIPNIYQEFGIRGTKAPTDLFEWITAGGLVEAHNAMMEKAVWRAIMTHDYLWPDIPRSQWRCSSAKASSYALPRSLEKACIVMRLPIQKDKEGHKLMMKLCKPRKVTKNNPKEWQGTREEFLRLFKYCESDVLSEEGFSHSLPDLMPLEQELWKIDQDINEHGLPIDRAFVEAAIQHLNTLRESANAEINRRTNGQVPKATSRVALLEWLNGNGLELDNTQAATFDALIDMPDDIPEHVIAVIKLVRRAGRASTAKYAAIMERMTSGNRVRDILVYAGASRTSRWCLTGDHEVLTPSGWVRLDKWGGGQIACWSEDGIFQFSDSRPLKFDYDGFLVRLESVRFSQVSTPDHGMPVSGIGKVRVEDLKRKHMIRRGGKLEKSDTFWPEGLVRLLVMTQADAHYTADGALRWHFKKERKVQRCKYLLDICRIPYRLIRNRRDGTTIITVGKTKLPAPLARFKDKTFCWSMIHCDHDAFFDELQHWDGFKVGPDSWQYSTCSRSNAEFVQAVAHLSGRSCNIVEQFRKEGEQHWNPNYRCNIWGKCPDFEFRPQHLTPEVSVEKEVYCAETQTGYFLTRRNDKVWVTGNSGAGFQPQNLPRGSIKDMEATVERIMASIDITDLEEEFQVEGEDAVDLFQLFSEALRGAIIADPGMELVSADYNAIEARGLFWVCNHERGLDIFRDKNRDIYLDMAEDIYQVPTGTYTKKLNPAERQVGKAGVLGCGFGLGKVKMVDYGSKAFASAKIDLVMDEALAEKVVKGYRTKHKPVVDFWYACERAAIEAMMHPGTTVWVNDKIAFKRANRFLFCRLPSGRMIPYPYPELRSEPSPFNKGEMKTVLTYEEVNSTTKKWERTKTYGGKLCLAGGTEVLTERGWTPITEVRLWDRVWDGVAFVPHSGVVFNGVKNTVNVSGVNMTPDHEVLSAKEWISASQSEGLDWHQVSLPDSEVLRRVKRQKIAVGKFSVRETGRYEPVYDITNCGPRNRFVVKGDMGHFVVHNCENIVQALCRDLMGYAMWTVWKNAKYKTMLTVHDELVAQCPIGTANVEEFEALMCILPVWAKGFPITAEGWVGERYRK